MPWDFDKATPVYMQIANELRGRIVRGTYAISSQLPSVRDLAIEASVNPNTVQRALSELEREELLRSGGTSGRTVTEEEGILTALREDTVMALARECAEKFKVFGVTPSQAAELLRQLDKEEN